MYRSLTVKSLRGSFSRVKTVVDFLDACVGALPPSGEASHAMQGGIRLTPKD